MTSSEIKYLTAIFEASKERGGIKQADLAKQMKISRVSVLRAIEKLEYKKLVVKDEKAQCELTEKGRSCVMKYIRCASFIEELLINALQSRPQNAKLEATAVLGAMSEANVEKLYRTMEEKEDALCR